MGRLSPGQQRRKKACPPVLFAFWVGSGLRSDWRSLRAPGKEGRTGFLDSAGEKRRRGRLCVRARVSSGAPGFCLSHNVTLEEEAGRASRTFLPALRLSSSPPTPSSSCSASCRHLHNKSPQVRGRERAGRAPVTGPRGYGVAALTPEKSNAGTRTEPGVRSCFPAPSPPPPLRTFPQPFLGCPLGRGTSPTPSQVL